MIKNKRTVYAGVLDIPEQQVGRFAIVHEHKPAGTELPLASARTHFFGGDRGKVTFDVPTRWHKLTETPGGTWMSDFPIEQYQHDKVLTKFKGTVLVGGLGLGYAVTALAHKRGVHHIVVVEKSPEVVAMVEPYILQRAPTLKKKVEVVTKDLFAFLKNNTEKFDYGFYDIWANDGERTFFDTVCPLRKLSNINVTDVTCWNENIMRGQLTLTLQSRIMFSENNEKRFNLLCDSDDKSIWIQWSKPFFQWYRKTHPNENTTQQAIKFYVFLYGMYPGWLQTWQTLLK